MTVHAQSLYEAAALALAAFREQGEAWLSRPGTGSKLEVEVMAPSMTHTVTVQKVEQWLASAGAPAEQLRKRAVREGMTRKA